MTHDEYQEYLRSDHWKEVKQRQPPTGCVECGVWWSLELHHKTYDRLGAERPEDLEWLCRECHREVHERERIEDPEPTREELEDAIDIFAELVDRKVEQLREEELFREFEGAMEVAAAKLAQYQEFRV